MKARSATESDMTKIKKFRMATGADAKALRELMRDAMRAPKASEAK